METTVLEQFLKRKKKYVPKKNFFPPLPFSVLTVLYAHYSCIYIILILNFTVVSDAEKCLAKMAYNDKDNESHIEQLLIPHSCNGSSISSTAHTVHVCSHLKRVMQTLQLL